MPGSGDPGHCVYITDDDDDADDDDADDDDADDDDDDEDDDDDDEPATASKTGGGAARARADANMPMIERDCTLGGGGLALEGRPGPFFLRPSFSSTSAVLDCLAFLGGGLGGGPAPGTLFAAFLRLTAFFASGAIPSSASSFSSTSGASG